MNLELLLNFLVGIVPGHGKVATFPEFYHLLGVFYAKGANKEPPPGFKLHALEDGLSRLFSPESRLS
ncbi:MAG: hypothetical protein CMN76_03355 [Spirochaetaceae bacterium]|nr:hypothetical protein [Spirochaetaceae bacterium]